MAAKVLQISELHPNPLNPRKDLGDLTELTASIRTVGVLQNLTVFPDTQGYTVLIGHRRLAAAKEAGLTELPCIIVKKPDEVEQISVMLQENMQRQGLTVPEEADGFQMVLDLGGSVKDLAKTTGFSEGTIRNRLAVHKVDRSLLAEKSWQLSVMDYVELAKIKNETTRNEVLRRAYDSRDLQNRVSWAVSQEKRESEKQRVIEWLAEKGIRPATEDEEMLLTVNNVKIYFHDFDPAAVDLSELGEGELVYGNGYDHYSVFIPTEREEEEPDERELYRQRAEKTGTELKKRIKDFFKLIYDGKIQVKDDEETLVKEMKKALFTGLFSNFDERDIAYILFDKNPYTQEAAKIAKEKKFHETVSFRFFKMMDSFHGLPDLKWANDQGKRSWLKYLEELGKYGFETPQECKTVLEEKHE